jgi:Antitoxin SocA-like, Panacea domain
MRNDKFDDLVHYVIWKCPDATTLGATKLNKILWFADAIHYLRTGQPVTAARYVEQQHGPVPQGFLKTRRRREKARAIAVAEGEFYGYRKHASWRCSARTSAPSPPTRSV